MAIPGYQIVRKIRQGGMSTVYLAVQKSVGREVALKVMSPALSTDPSFGDRFYREAKIVGQLSHPNIVSIYDVGSYKQYNYIAMDYLPGEPLQDRLRKGVELKEALRITRDVASALECTHQRGYIHRDIKPDNVLFRADGSTVLCDFGIARAVKSNLNMTNMGSVLGTPHYMSPEQAQGKSVDGRTDIYSLGIVFYEMLTGTVPFTGDDPIEVAIKHLSAAPPKLPPQLRLLQPVINKMLAKKPANRYQSAAELLQALDRAEQLMNKRPDARGDTEPSAVQVFSLVGALLSTLGAVTAMKLKRLGRSVRRSPAISASDQQQLDKFVLGAASGDLESETVVDSRPATLPGAQRRARYWLYGPALIAALLLAGFLYYSEYEPEKLRQAYRWVQGVPAAAQAEPAPEPPATSTGAAEPAPVASAPEAQADEAVEPEPEASPPPPPATYRLTVTTEPSDATVRILNIRPVYEPGIELEPGPYHIEVSAEDYHSEKRWVKLKQEDLTVAISLEPTRRLLPAGTLLSDPLAEEGRGPEMVVLPQGTLKLGTGQTVTVDEALAMGTREVSFEDYDRFARDTGRALPDDFGWGRGERPVVGVSWSDAVAYAEWLSEQTGQQYRLPSYGVWRYAASAGEPGAFWWGDQDADGRANCRRGCNSEWSKLFSASTAPTASYPANPYGVHDTAGNAAEWLADCLTRIDDRCETRAAAGGSYRDSAQEIGSDHVEAVPGGAGERHIGFRLVLVL